MENKQTANINIQVKKELADELKTISKRMEIPYAQFVRAAIKQAIKIAKEKEMVNEQ